MKKIITIVFAGILMLSTQANGQGFTINGTVDGVDEGKVTVQARGGSKYATGIENGKFTLKGKVVEPALHSLRIEGVRGSTQIFIENAIIELRASKDDLRNAKISGSKAHDVYQKYNELNMKLSEASRPLYKASSEARKANNESEIKRIEGELEKVREKQSDAREEFIRENPKSIVSAYILASMA